MINWMRSNASNVTLLLAPIFLLQMQPVEFLYELPEPTHAYESTQAHSPIFFLNNLRLNKC